EYPSGPSKESTWNCIEGFLPKRIALQTLCQRAGAILPSWNVLAPPPEAGVAQLPSAQITALKRPRF
ncbi:MAG TPA: hypothetical protein VKM54_07925, partial [Myxococcota bacterium]|nr:hypothetical protein [Myxococcota bacterium]